MYKRQVQNRAVVGSEYAVNLVRLLKQNLNNAVLQRGVVLGNLGEGINVLAVHHVGIFLVGSGHIQIQLVGILAGLLNSAFQRADRGLQTHVLFADGLVVLVLIVGVGVSTVSYTHLYGVQIFVRKPRGIELTDDGKDFVHYAKGVLTASQVLKQRFSSLAETDGRESRLFVGAQQLDFVYQMFLEIYEQNKDKNIHYNLVETDRNSVIEQVLHGAVDLGIFVRSSADDKTRCV